MDLDFTVSEVLDDLMIAQLNKADGISERAFAQLMQSAARVRSFGVSHKARTGEARRAVTATPE